MSERTLHGSDATPYGRIVRMVLAELDLPYARDVRKTDERTHDEMAALNPVLRIPILEEPDGQVLHDSRVIAEYLLGTYPIPRDTPDSESTPPLLPMMGRPENRWEDAVLLATLYSMLEGAVTLRQLTLSGVAVAGVNLLQRHEARLVHGLDWLEVRADPDGLLPGWFSVQDMALVSLLDFGDRFGIFQWRGHPRLEALYARLGTRASVAGTRPG